MNISKAKQNMKLTKSIPCPRFVKACTAAVGLLASGCLLHGGLIIDLSGPPIELQPETAGQTIVLFVQNAGVDAAVGGFDLKLSINAGVGPAPQVTGVNLRSGPVFTTANSAQSSDPLNTPYFQFWSVSVNDPGSPPSLPGSGQTTQIGVLSVSTVGLSSGQWPLSLISGDTDLLDPAGNSLALVVTGGTLAVVPEPAIWGLLSATACLVVAVVERGLRKRPHD